MKRDDHETSAIKKIYENTTNIPNTPLEMNEL